MTALPPPATARTMHVSFGCFVGPIVAFDTLRIHWARDAGYNIVPGVDFGAGYRQPDYPDLPWDTYSVDDHLGEWPEGAPDDPLIILLIHEENAGRIKAAHVGPVADALEALNVTYPSPYVLPTQDFIRGLRYAASQNIDVLFT